MKLKMTGIKELQKKLKSNVTMNDVKRVVKQNGAELQQKVQRRAPNDTGTLERSIGLDITAGGFIAEVEPADEKNPNTEMPAAEYAPYVEYGTRFMAAQPYVRPAFNEQKQQFKRDMKKLVR